MDTTVETGCYCGTSTSDSGTLVCEKCCQLYHIGCLRYGRLSPLQGDTLFTLVCARCSNTGEETYTRIKLSWQQVVTLVLYNLHLETAGRQGYFHWKEHICASILKYWMTLFGNDRKKTATWCGTVAGTLSSGCPNYFRSGTNILKESGWWALAQIAPPTRDTASKSRTSKRQRKDVSPGEPPVKVEGLRRRAQTSSIDAAIALRAKRDMTQDVREVKRSRATHTAADCQLKRPSVSAAVDDTSPQLKQMSATQESLVEPATSQKVLHSTVLDETCGVTVRSVAETGGITADTDHCNSWSERQWLTERELMAGDGVPAFLLKDDDESDLEIDPCTLSSPTGAGEEDGGDGLPQMSEILAPLRGLPHLEEGMNLNITVEKQTISREDCGVETPSINTVDWPEVAHDVKEEAESETSDIDTRTIKEEMEIKSETDQGWLPTQNESSTDDPPPRTTACSDTDSESRSEAESESGDSGPVSTQTKPVHRRRPRKLAVDNHLPVQASVARHIPLSLYEERELLRKLTVLTQGYPRVWRLRRKMLIRQKKREQGLATFDLDRMMSRLTAPTNDQSEDHQQHLGMVFEGLISSSDGSRWNQAAGSRVLDRFQMLREPWSRPDRYIPFRSRLVGFEDDQLECVRSPYTARLLKPFIRRDYETEPLKLKLLREIEAYGHRSQPHWVVERPPIDYCYVRPQHIPSINQLCCEFFWPGIDLSESLQYPDFSCVVLYRRLVIGFAFMVPDVKYNEAYISFIFTHPEWVRAGIGQFMVYHLIQTCMGKDVTLHVSADNPAMLLYQKFGFKPQELILGFYDRYFADDSHQSRHAFFMRLQR